MENGEENVRADLGKKLKKKNSASTFPIWTSR